MSTILEFGPFRLDGSALILSRGTEPVAVGKRAVALLGLLVRSARAPVGKDALIEVAWPGQAVGDGNLTVQIAALRRVLAGVPGGAGWIETLPRRGYRWVGPCCAGEGPAAGAAAPSVAIPAWYDRPSIAVLRFSNLSGDPGQDYFGDGMVEDIIAGLSRIKGLLVIARGSSFTFRGDSADPRRLGRTLGARYLLQGSLRRDDQRVRVATRLLEAETGGLIWAERYDRPRGDILAVQDEIALAVVGAIGPSLRRAEMERVRRVRPDSLDAYDLVLQAQPDIYTGMPERVTRALVLLRRALALDPNYAMAHAFAAMCHHSLFLRAGLGEEDRAASLHHARAAIAHGQDDALALTLAGFSIGMDGHDRAGAFAAFDAALAISPSSAVTYILGGVIHGWAGQAESAIDWGERALRLSPLDPWVFAAYHALVLGHFHRGHFDAAAEAAHRAVLSNPGHSISQMLLAALLARLGRLCEARSAAARVLQLQPGFTCGRQLSGVDCAPQLAASLTDALRPTGLPE